MTSFQLVDLIAKKCGRVFNCPNGQVRHPFLKTGLGGNACPILAACDEATRKCASNEDYRKVARLLDASVTDAVATDFAAAADGRESHDVELRTYMVCALVNRSVSDPCKW